MVEKGLYCQSGLLHSSQKLLISLDCQKKEKGGLFLLQLRNFSKETKNILRSFGIEMVEAKDLNDLRRKLADLLGSDIPVPLP